MAGSARSLRPVGNDSVVVPREGITCEDIEGAPTLVDRVTGHTQPLTPLGAAVWECLDGRSVGAVIGELQELSRDAEMPGEAIERLPVRVREVIRRLRALVLAEDAPVEPT